MRTYTGFALTLAIGLFGTSAALAQGAPAGGAPPAGGAAPAAAPAEGAAPAAAAGEGAVPEGAPAEGAKPTTGDNDVVADAEAGSSPVELPNKTYRFVGARYRAIIVPKFMVNLFGDGGRTVVVHSFGPEFVIRKNGFEYDFALTYAGYGMEPTKFKSSTDEEPAWEIVESKLKIIYLTTDFLWSTEFSPEFALNYGMGAGFGIVFGDLIREQAYQNTSGDYVRCPNAPPPGSAGYRPTDQANQGTLYCGSDNDHYNGYKEPGWFDSGSKPVIFPWFALQTGLRFKPAKTFASRIDLGFGTSGFFAGIGLDYGL